MQVLIERKWKEKKERKKEDKGKGQMKREKEVLFPPVFYKPIVCLVFYSFLPMYYYFSQVKSTLNT